MIFKLLVPYYSRQFHGGTVAAWHKRPGDRVQFGDELFDIQVSEMTWLKGSPDLAKDIRILTSPKVAEMMLRGRPEPPEGAPAQNPDMYMTMKTETMMRVVASDVGVLRLILAEPGAPCAVGDPVALLSAEGEEPLGEVDEALRAASVFRAVPNLVEPMESPD